MSLATRDPRDPEKRDPEKHDAERATSTAEATEPRARKPYAKPAVIFEEPIEGLAATCTPSPPAKTNPAVCPRGPISS